VQEAVTTLSFGRGNFFLNRLRGDVEGPPSRDRGLLLLILLTTGKKEGKSGEAWLHSSTKNAA